MVLHMPGETTMPPSEIENLQSQIDKLEKVVEKGFDELKCMLRKSEERVRAVENVEATCNPMTMKRLTDIENDVLANGKDIKALKEIVTGLQHTNKVLSWILGVLTVVGTSLIITLITKMVGG